MILGTACILIFIAYSVLILYYWQSWRQVPGYIVDAASSAKKISVIIPARNEAQNIATLLTSLQQQDYPAGLFEIIVIDDHSEDNTADIVRSFHGVTLLQLQEGDGNAYKKKAIESGIRHASGELIVTTDADCICGTGWLKTINAFQQETAAVFIASPVGFSCPGRGNRLLYYFQVLDFLVLQGITGAAVFKNTVSMCNGANLAYARQAFIDVNGFAGIDHIASGDDMLLMHKIKGRFPGRVRYLKSKEAIVNTQAAKTWRSFFNQRIRWASKANKYDDKNIFWILLLVYLFNFSFLLLLIAGGWNPVYWLYAAGLWVAKTIIEFPFVYSVARFFGRQSLMACFFFFQPLHIFYTIIAGWLGQFGSYEWKGRKVN